MRKLEVHKNDNINHEHVYSTHCVPGTPLILLCLLTYLNAVVITDKKTDALEVRYLEQPRTASQWWNWHMKS